MTGVAEGETRPRRRRPSRAVAGARTGVRHDVVAGVDVARAVRNEDHVVVAVRGYRSSDAGNSRY